MALISVALMDRNSNRSIDGFYFARKYLQHSEITKMQLFFPSKGTSLETMGLMTMRLLP